MKKSDIGIEISAYDKYVLPIINVVDLYYYDLHGRLNLIRRKNEKSIQRMSNLTNSDGIYHIQIPNPNKKLTSEEAEYLCFKYLSRSDKDYYEENKRLHEKFIGKN